MKHLIFPLATLALFSCLTSCDNGDDMPEPEEQELITTLQLIVTPQPSGAEQTFIYKVQNGFGSTTPGTVQIDTLALTAGTTYNVRLRVLNETASPAEDITEEIISEKDEHLFLYTSDAATGAGSITVSGGSTDGQGRPFNQTAQLAAGAAGSGSLTVTLLHVPTNKAATTPAAAGGETDLEAVFPVRLAP